MRRFFFSGCLSAEECQDYYRGLIQYVIVTADGGERVQLHFRHFQRFVQSNGFRGRFRLTVDDNNAFVALEKIN